jgi:hypothetical protein
VASVGDEELGSERVESASGHPSQRVITDISHATVAITGNLWLVAGHADADATPSPSDFQRRAPNSGGVLHQI